MKRYFVERKSSFQDNKVRFLNTIKEDLGLSMIDDLRIFLRYDIEEMPEEHESEFITKVLSVPYSDDVYHDILPADIMDWHLIGIESLPGQYDQRADSCMQCTEVIIASRPNIKTATIYAFSGDLDEKAKLEIEKYLLNPVEARLVDATSAYNFGEKIPDPQPVPSVLGFTRFGESDLKELLDNYGLAMDLDDLKVMQNYFRDELLRDPTETELRMVDTYWSDHCRHTTFMTELRDISIENPQVQDAFDRYQSIRELVYGDKIATRPVTLMDMATIATKYLKKQGKVSNLDESEEINACSIQANVDEDGIEKPWLFMFKNETHNHPTEIEPFGGASTCLGGAIRDPLSGRSYIHQGLRLTGAADPRKSLSETRSGKLPQKKICTLAAKGFSSYGNQIGVATGLVDEVYHPGYEAKRMEVGAVIAAAPAENVVRQEPQAGDIVVLLGGRTGRDGIGGATGSSKTHTEDSLETSGAEVQKGNPVEERKIQRLFRRGDVASKIKRCNDFGAGGVSVAVGELSDGVRIELDHVPLKYLGLNGSEIALSESQERMACVIAKTDWEEFAKAAYEENLEATVIAEVTDDDMVTMTFKGQKVVEITRDFLNSAGAKKQQSVRVKQEKIAQEESIDSFSLAMESLISGLNICSKRGLVEQFDATIGANTVLFPLGGKYQSTPIQTMAAKIPVLYSETNTASLFAYGFDPDYSSKDPYQGAYDAVVESVCKLMASGASNPHIYLTLQEYFHSLRTDNERWGEPFKAVLGALMAQIDLEIPAIGGKDSMSGSFEELDVPPTLVSFATTLTKADRIISPELKSVDNKIYKVSLERNSTNGVKTDAFINLWDKVIEAIEDGIIVSGWAVSRGGIAEGLFKMTLGNKLGVAISEKMELNTLFKKNYGTVLFECTEELPFGEVIGQVIGSHELQYDGEDLNIDLLTEAYESTLENVYPTNVEIKEEKAPMVPLWKKRPAARQLPPISKPKVVIPVFPGSNCEYDMARSFISAGADVEAVVVGNITPNLLKESSDKLEKAIQNAQILALPGGFSFGDEPDGSGKFISAFLRQDRLSDAIMNLITKHDGLILGICNGFQALVKLGLLPYGEIKNPVDIQASLNENLIGRHQSRYVQTRITSVASPWLNGVELGDIHSIPISHGEGRFMASDDVIESIMRNGQIAMQYVDYEGNPSMRTEFNPNGSSLAIEGLVSLDGRILGKMGHSERYGSHIAKNIHGNKDQKLFASGVNYFKN